VSPLNYALQFALQLRKSTKNFSRGSDVVGEKWNLQIVVNLPVTNVQLSVGRNAKALGL
jgi:hypothetical protein